MSNIETILAEIAAERAHQDAKWGGAAHDSTHSAFAWCASITRYQGKLLQGWEDGATNGQLRHRMVQIAALACAALQHCPDLQLPADAPTGKGENDGH